MSALSNLGTVAGALGASALWELFGLPFGLLLPSVLALLAGFTLLALAPGRPVAAPAPLRAGAQTP